MSQTCDFAANWARFDAEAKERSDRAAAVLAEIDRLYVLEAGNPEELRLAKLADELMYRLLNGTDWQSDAHTVEGAKRRRQFGSARTLWRGQIIEIIDEAANYRRSETYPPGWEAADGGGYVWQHDGLTIRANYSASYWSARAESERGFVAGMHGGDGYQGDDDDEDPEYVDPGDRLYETLDGIARHIYGMYAGPDEFAADTPTGGEGAANAKDGGNERGRRDDSA